MALTVRAADAQTAPEPASETFSFSEFKEENIDRVLLKLGDRTSLTLAATGALASLAVQPSDPIFREEWRENRRMSRDLSNAGDILGSGFVSAALIGGQYLWDTDATHWQSHARAFIWQTAVTQVMKYSFGVQRPGNKNRYESFPSGHTATAFATATSLTYAYGWKAGAVAYPLAAFVGLARMSDDMHWASDVVAGAFVGVIVARASAPDEQGRSSSAWAPVVGPDLNGLTYLYSF